MKSQAVGLPADSRWVWLQQEAAQELDEGLFVSKFVELTDKSHTKLILLATDTIPCFQAMKVKSNQQHWHLASCLISSVGYFGGWMFTIYTTIGVIRCLSLPHLLCLCPCPLFCSFYWKTCSGRIGKLLPVQCYQSLPLRMTKKRRKSWPAPCCHTGRRREVVKVLGKHPHPPGSWPEGGSTERLESSRKAEGKDTVSVNTKLISSDKIWHKTYKTHLQSSFMQNFCQLIVRWVAISAQAFRCSICTK